MARNDGARKYAKVISDPARVETARLRVREHFQRLRQRIVTILGGKCVECGHSDGRSLHIDHVRSNGAEERRSGAGTAYYKHILENIESGDYVLLCACHNDIKRHDMDEYSHACGRRGCGRKPNDLTNETDPKKLAARVYNLRHKARVEASPEMQEWRRIRHRRTSARLRQQVIEALGGVCVKCGWSDPRALHVDHVHGGGRQHSRAVGSAAIYRDAIKNAGSGAYALLCSNHNQQKRADNDESALGRTYLGKRKYVYATEAPPPEKPRNTIWTPERYARRDAARAAQAAADAALALVLAAKREAAKNPPAESSGEET